MHGHTYRYLKRIQVYTAHAYRDTHTCRGTYRWTYIYRYRKHIQLLLLYSYCYACAYSILLFNCLTGKPYSSLGKRQQRRRKTAIKISVAKYLKPLRSIGIKPVSLLLTTEDDSQKIDLKYLSCVPAGKENRTFEAANHKNTESVLYLLMKRGVSMKFYHELSMILRICQESIR